MPLTTGVSDFIFRDARPEDRDEVLAFTADTWEGGDYIQWVYDEWLADSTGRFLVAVEASTGKLAGIDKLSFLSPSEAWFEGIRVNPAYRGRGLAAGMQRALIEVARALGAHTIRFITNAVPGPIHRIAYRDGFRQRFIVRNWTWKAEYGVPAPTGAVSGHNLRNATASEAPTLHDWWARSASFQATEGMADRGWSFAVSSQADWRQAAAEGRLLVAGETRIDSLALPPPTCMFLLHSDEHDGPVWHISVLSAPGGNWESLAAGIVDRAAQAGVSRVQGLMPDMAQVHEAVQAVGFRGDSPYGRFALFELLLAENEK